MDQLPGWVNIVTSLGGLIGTLITAVATIFLWKVTKVLARETTRMVEASSQPHVVATLDPNRWSMRHFDLNVNNTGNGTAYDISVKFDPPLGNGEERKNKDVPLTRISVLKPGQGISSYLSGYGPLDGKTYKVTISWRKSTGAEQEENIYTLRMTDVQDISVLGGDPVIKIAEHLKKLQEDVAKLGSNANRIQVDAFLTTDRLHEKKVYAREARMWRQKRAQDVVMSKNESS
jgi:hypothetical protein